MSFCCETRLKVSRDNIQFGDTHTHIAISYFCYTMSVTRPTTRMQDIVSMPPFQSQRVPFLNTGQSCFC